MTSADTNASDSSRPLLVADGINVTYGGVRAVADVSLRLEPGVLYGLVGPNGSGKSSLLAAISHSGKLSGGRIVFDGVDCTRMRADQLARRGVARTFQAIRLLPHMTLRENVAIGADVDPGVVRILLHGIRQVAARRADGAARYRADEALERVGLAHLAHRLPGELSYGMQRKVEIARALASRPKLLLLDEPTAGMNEQERTEIAELLAELRGDGLTQLLVEHNLRMMVRVTDHLYVLDYGQIIASAPPREAVAHPEVVRAYLGAAPTTTVDS